MLKFLSHSAEKGERRIGCGKQSRACPWSPGTSFTTRRTRRIKPSLCNCARGRFLNWADRFFARLKCSEHRSVLASPHIKDFQAGRLAGWQGGSLLSRTAATFFSCATDECGRLTSHKCVSKGVGERVPPLVNCQPFGVKTKLRHVLSFRAADAIMTVAIAEVPITWLLRPAIGAVPRTLVAIIPFAAVARLRPDRNSARLAAADASSDSRRRGDTSRTRRIPNRPLTLASRQSMAS